MPALPPHLRWPISKQDLLDALVKGVERTIELIDHATEFHGGVVETEYLITGDIARELIHREYKVKVECLNRKLVNALTRKREVSFDADDPRGERNGLRTDDLGSQRTDVAIINDLHVPFALIEVKIRVRNLKSVSADIEKICNTLSQLTEKHGTRAWGVSLFQMNLDTTNKRVERHEFVRDVRAFEDEFKQQLADHANMYSEFSFEFHPLQQGDNGIQGPRIEEAEYPDGYKENVLVSDGMAIRFYAVLIRKQELAQEPNQ